MGTEPKIRYDIFAFCFFLTLFLVEVFAQGKSAEQGLVPTIKSVFPLGGKQGSHFDIVVRGESLEGAHAVWLDCQSITGKVKDVNEINLNENPDEYGDPKKNPDSPKGPKGYQVLIEVEIDSSAKLGAHRLRLLTGEGLSNALWFLVDSEVVVSETDRSHSALTEAQPVNFGVVINGKVSKPGELDYYSFEVESGQKLQMEVRAFQSSEPTLILYQPTGSWFDPSRGVRLEVTDVWRPQLGRQVFVTGRRLPRVRRVFKESGTYMVEVGTVDGEGGPDYSYQLRIVPLSDEELERHRHWGPIPQAAHGGGAVAWESRDFTSRMGSDWLRRIRSRSISTSRSPELSTVIEKEPNNVSAQSNTISTPLVFEGVIGYPADVDWFAIEVNAAEKLAFEIETPYLPPPFFNAQITVFNLEGQELASNVYRSLGGDGDDWIKTLVPKILYTFDKEGHYFIRVRDLTSRVGGREFTYRIVVRPQVPHVGKVTVKREVIPLRAGQSQSINVTTEFEEGFQGEVALTVENLPPGVSAATAVSDGEKSKVLAAEKSSKPGGQIHRDRHFPQRYSANIILVTSNNPPPTPTPQEIRIIARPVLKGKTGEALVAQKILVTVTDENK